MSVVCWLGGCYVVLCFWFPNNCSFRKYFDGVYSLYASEMKVKNSKGPEEKEMYWMQSCTYPVNNNRLLHVCEKRRCSEVILKLPAAVYVGRRKAFFHIIVLWDVTLCNWVSCNWRFEGQYKVKGKGVPQQTEVALGVPGRLKPRIISTFGITRVVGRQPNTPAAFTPGEIPGTHFQRLSRHQGTWFCRKKPRKNPKWHHRGSIQGPSD